MIATIILSSLLAVAMWEFLQPRRGREFPALRRRLSNIGIGVFNTIAVALLFVPADRLRPAWALPPLVGFVLGFLLLDLMSYLMHRAQHAVPLFWRLHAMHHSDPDVDWSTAARNHPLEALGAAAVGWGLVLALAIPGPVVAAYATTAFVLMAATHGNVRWPRWAETVLRPVVITLDLHLVHHSIVRAEADSNFGQVLAIWDRIFGTFARPTRVERLCFGVDGLPRADAVRAGPMLATPWRVK